MAITLEKVLGVISRPPANRNNFEINNLMPWFRKKAGLFRTLKTELLFDIIKHLQLETKKRDDIIIRQGEKGDCMYILLRGQVTIFIKTDNEEDNPAAQVPKPGESIRTVLGTLVCSLGAGAAFGEVALISEDCIRTASIIADDFADLIVVDRELYDRSVKFVLQKEFEDKSNFIATSPFFSNWPPKYKKQLAMALVKDSIPYENYLTRQGEPAQGIYFILSGEVKLLTDPSQHETQYPKLGPLEDEKPLIDDENNEVDELLKKMSIKKTTEDSTGMPHYRRKSKRKSVLELCLLGVNECIGDMEVLMDMDTSMQTAITTQRTEVLILEMKHYERLLVKRNPRTIDLMKRALPLKISSRISPQISGEVPLLKCLSLKLDEYLEQKEQVTVARAKAKENKNNKPTPKKLSDSFNTFIPVRGSLVDQYGPGTVFHRIRQRQKVKAKQIAASRYSKNADSTPGKAKKSINATAIRRPSSAGARMDDTKSTLHNSVLTSGSAMTPVLSVTKELLTPDQIDPVLSSLETRMRAWLTNDKGTGKNSMSKTKWQVYNLRPVTAEGRTRKAPSKSTKSTSNSDHPLRPKSRRYNKVHPKRLISGMSISAPFRTPTLTPSGETVTPTGEYSTNQPVDNLAGEKDELETLIYTGNAFV